MTTARNRAIPCLTGPFRGTAALAQGVLNRRQLRSGLFVRLFRDAYLPAAIPVTYELRCRAAGLVIPPHAVLTGCSAAALRGIDLAGTREPVEVLVPEDDSFHQPLGMHVRYVPIKTGEYETTDGIRVATPMRAAFDLLVNTKLRRSLPHAVGVLDALLHHGLLDLGELERLLYDRHDHGVVRAREAAALADARAESVLRVLLVRADIPVVPQVEVRSNGQFVARLDLAVRGRRVAIEYDGAWHHEAQQADRDDLRRARLRALGWQVIVVDKQRLRDDREGIVRAVRAAISGVVAA